VYSQLITDKSLHRLAQSGITPRRRDVAQCIDISKRLKSLIDLKTGAYSRPLTADEKAFCRSETILCRHDFRYFAERYGSIDLDASTGGGVAPIKFWAAQERALELIGRREEEVEQQFDKHGFSDGILTVWTKSRQLGATALMRLVTFHRMLLWRNTRCIAASLDIDKIHEIYVRDKTVLDNLPPFLVPAMEFDVKDSQISFANLKSRLTYQQANQEAGVGTGQQFDITHLTEVAFWRMGDRIKLDLLPAIPQSPRVFLAFESTANGRGNFWHEFTEDVRLKHEGFEHWVYVFTPWFIEPKKNRRAAPDDWRPNQVTIEHAELVERTSGEYCASPVTLSRDQLYWWQTEYMQHKKEGSLHIFFSNNCATPQQSFQHSTRSALPLETVEWMRSTALMGMPYNVEVMNARA
jgi:hypothetical protein